MNVVRGLVSKQKKRFVENDFDLDLTYVPTGEKTSAARDRIIAMGFPSEGYEGYYRNPMSEVIRFFETYHKDHFKIYNLCSERAYDVRNFFGMPPVEEEVEGGNEESAEVRFVSTADTRGEGGGRAVYWRGLRCQTRCGATALD